MSRIDTVRELMDLTTNVKKLLEDVREISKILREQDRRITMLEASRELTIEQAKNASLAQTMDIMGSVFEKFSTLERNVAALPVKMNGPSE
jgi:hypothetical protein